MVTEILTLDEFNHVKSASGLNVFKFTAPSWCAPCRALAPHYKAASDQVEANFYSIDIDHAEPALVDTCNIMSVPTVIAFRDGEYVGPVEGRTVLQLVNELG